MTDIAHNNDARSRYVLLILMLLPILVVLAATFVFYTGIGLPKNTHNKGVLVAPPVQINDMKMLDKDGKTFTLDVKKDLWAFLTVHSAACDEDCKQLFWMNRQTRIALGKYQEHIRRIWLVTDGKLSEDTMQWLAKEQADVLVVYGDSLQWNVLLKTSNYAATHKEPTNFFLMDPRGFVMMYYTTQNTYKDVIADMKFLLKGVE
jgi:cytochrome oxidase Cu insertion factor (SCO1/SenC/PrrC family)